MAASDKDITIKITVDAKGAVTAFQQIEGLAQQTGRNMQQSQQGAVNAIQSSYTELLSKINLVKEAYSVLSGAVGVAVDAIKRGSAVGDVTEAFGKLSERAGTTADVFLNQLNQATGETIANFDLMRKANESLRAGIKPDEMIVLTQAARALSEETGQNLSESIEEVTRAFESGRVQMLKNRLGIIDVEAAENKLAAQLGKTREQLTKDEQVLASRTGLLEASRQKTKEFGTITNDAADNLEAFNKFLTDAKDKFFEAISKNESLNILLSELSETVKNIDFEPLINGLVKIIEIGAQVVTTLINIAVALGKTFDSKATKIERAIEPVLSFKEALAKLQQEASRVSSREGLERVREQGAKLETQFKQLYRQLDDQTRQAFIDLAKGVSYVGLEFPKATKKVEEHGKSHKNTKKDVDETNAALNKAGEAATDLAKIPIYGPGNDHGIQEFIDQTHQLKAELSQTKGLADLFFDFSDVGDKDLANSIAGMFADAFAQVGEKMLSGEVIHREDWANITSGITSGIANSLIPGSGPLVDLATDFVFSLFGGENAGTTARKEADKFFADIFDANRLMVIIDGELARIKDLTFGSFSEGTGSFDVFQSLPDDARKAFQGVGYAFEELLGNAEIIGGQLAAVFANNVGGSLNNLQLLVRTTGKSFEDLSKLVVDSFLKGQLSALEAQQALEGIQKIAEKGIPDGLGLTNEAFQNLKDASAKGGAVAIDALQDLASEAKELGLKTLPELNANLASSGRFTTEELQKLFTALKTYGVDSLDKLESLSDETAIAILANLQVNNFPFDEAIESIQSIREEIDKIPQNVKRTLTFDVKINASAQDRQLLNQAQISPGLGIA